MKVKITGIYKLTFDLKPEYYEPGATLEDMVAADIANAEDDPVGFADAADNVSFTYEVIES